MNGNQKIAYLLRISLSTEYTVNISPIINITDIMTRSLTCLIDLFETYIRPVNNPIKNIGILLTAIMRLSYSGISINATVATNTIDIVMIVALYGARLVLWYRIGKIK